MNCQFDCFFGASCKKCIENFLFCMMQFSHDTFRKVSKTYLLFFFLLEQKETKIQSASWRKQPFFARKAAQETKVLFNYFFP